MQPYYSDNLITLYHARAEAVLDEMADDSVNLIFSDSPYFKIKREWWDRQWDKPEGFLSWMDGMMARFARVLKPNGSLYVCASPEMSYQVEGIVRRRFNVLNNIRWQKEAGWHKKMDKEIVRSFLHDWETIIFAEHFGADTHAKGLAGYESKCDELRGFVFEPIRGYLDGERKRAGVDKADCNAACGFSRTPGGMASRHYFSRSQWCLPTQEHYESLQSLFNASCNGSGPQYLRREYDDLRREYDDLRRPFNMTADMPYTDVWDFPTVQAAPGKHPCEKPLKMLMHILTASTRPGDVIFDPFCGSGVTLDAARRLGRKAIGIDAELKWVRCAARRVSQGWMYPPTDNAVDFAAAGD